MSSKFAPGDHVFFRVNKDNLVRDIRAVVLNEKFNGGNGGFYTIRFLTNGREITVHKSSLCPG